MEFKAKEMSVRNMVNWTYYSRQRVENLLANAKEIETDARKEERLKAQNCRCCFYSTKAGGAAITTQPCMCCHEGQMYGSTCTDALCLDCAKKHSLCAHCGGDLEMRDKRRKWPEPDAQGDTDEP